MWLLFVLCGFFAVLGVMLFLQHHLAHHSDQAAYGHGQAPVATGVPDAHSPKDHAL